MAQIGEVQCTFIKGHAPKVKMRVELWRVPGLNGYGAQALGLQDSPFEFTAILYSNAAGVLAWKEALEALQGTIISIVNDLGITYANCLILKLSNLKSIPALAPGGITQRGEITIEGVVTA